MFECVSGLHRFSASRAELGLSTPVTSAQRTRHETSCDPRHVGDGRSASYVSAAEEPSSLLIDPGTAGAAGALAPQLLASGGDAPAT